MHVMKKTPQQAERVRKTKNGVVLTDCSHSVFLSHAEALSIYHIINKKETDAKRRKTKNNIVRCLNDYGVYVGKALLHEIAEKAMKLEKTCENSDAILEAIKNAGIEIPE